MDDEFAMGTKLIDFVLNVVKQQTIIARQRPLYMMKWDYSDIGDLRIIDK